MNQEHNLLIHIDALYRTAMYLTKNTNNADDLVQDTYLRAFKFLKNNNEVENARPGCLRY